VHPGYGFLSENAEFSRQCASNGIAFIGPPPNAMNELGDKIHSKLLARAAGVSTVPGYAGEVNSEAEAIKICTLRMRVSFLLDDRLADTAV
jgi:acetyl/propionyl-CoA carboxylase alpha subunit